MFKLTTLRVFAQIASLVLALSLRSISNEVLGNYAISLSILSIISAVITYEGTFLVISRNIYPSNFFTNLKFNRVAWVLVSLLVIYNANLGPIVSMCLIGFLLTLDFEYLINLITLGDRVHGKDEIFRKYLERKIILVEFLFPLLSVAAIYFNIITYILALYLIIFFSINSFMFWIGYKRTRKYSLYRAIPSIKGTMTSFLKRSDSQLQRLVIGALFGSAFLGSIYPALIIGRAGSIIGNIWYTYYFNRSKQVISAGNKFLKFFPIILFSLLVVCTFYAYLSQWIFATLFDWNVEVLIYATFFFINIQFLYKTFIRSIATNIRKIQLFNITLTLSLVIKLICAYTINIGVVNWLFLSVVIDLILFCFLQMYIFYLKDENQSAEIKILRITSLPTKDYPASGLTSHMISEGSNDLLAIPFPKELCLFNYADSKIISDLKIDLRDKKNFKWFRFLISIYYSFVLSRIALKNKVNVVHVHWIPLIFVCIFLNSKKTKFILTIHGEDARYLDYFLFKIIVKRFSKIYVVGSYWTTFLKERNFNIEEIPNFSPIDEAVKNNLNKKPLSKTITKKLCVIASEKSHKNLMIFSKMPNDFYEDLESLKISLTIVGISEDYFKEVSETKSIPDGIFLPGRQSRIETLSIISESDLLLIPSFTEGNPKVVWESVELGIFPVISEPLIFLGYNHNNYPFRFNPNDAIEFWKKINEALKTKENIDLNEYFEISSHISVREEYNKTYLK